MISKNAIATLNKRHIDYIKKLLNIHSVLFQTIFVKFSVSQLIK